MAEETGIGWADDTQNDWIGCDEVAPECANCYAKSLNKAYGWMKAANADGKLEAAWGAGIERYRVSAKTRARVFMWNKQASGWKVRRRVFFNSLSDWLDEEAPIEWLAESLVTMFATENLDWLLVSKRYENFEERLARAFNTPLMRANSQARAKLYDWIKGDAPKNIHLGMTCGSSKMLSMLPTFRDIPAVIRFLSVEPLLENLIKQRSTDILKRLPQFDLTGINGIVIGGESGPKARPMHPFWLMDWVRLASVYKAAVFFKQWGAWMPKRQAEAIGLEWPPKSGQYGTLNLNGQLVPGVEPRGSGSGSDGLFTVGKYDAKLTGNVIEGRRLLNIPTTSGVIVFDKEQIAEGRQPSCEPLVQLEAPARRRNRRREGEDEQ